MNFNNSNDSKTLFSACFFCLLILEYPQFKKSYTDDVPKLLSSKLLMGWALLDDYCNNHFVPLMRSPHNKLLKECVLCVEEQEQYNNMQLNREMRTIDKCFEKKENNNNEKDNISSFSCNDYSARLSEWLQILDHASNNIFSSLKKCSVAISSANVELELHLISKIKLCVETLESLERCKTYLKK
ncbi:hypothetical protein PNEG_00615 [Pneumocystis murina B123]|uniref:Uncharacterized protein n=1 Tax=Pneumocystis murina (strain B123) TaxID=1069680 RepID=M7PAW0_PNEMU|nr:hypothetical protein PNEG_00615 [Pneumocystis murina B123]EMR11015.1 hypothetical protein PNEG_00615 [Pneumocystis murina B123]